MKKKKVSSKFLEQRLRAIRQGIRNAIRKEVQRLRELGLPIYVDVGGKVSILHSTSSVKSKRNSS